MMPILVAFGVILLIGSIVSLVWLLDGLIEGDYRWLFERNPPARKVLLAMLRNLAEEESLWERRDRTYTHRDSGVSFVTDGFYSYNIRLNTGRETVEFAHKSRGWRICQSVCDAVARREKLQQDLAALESMNAAFRRMNDGARG